MPTISNATADIALSAVEVTLDALLAESLQPGLSDARFRAIAEEEAALRAAARDLRVARRACPVVHPVLGPCVEPHGGLPGAGAPYDPHRYAGD